MERHWFVMEKGIWCLLGGKDRELLLFSHTEPVFPAAVSGAGSSLGKNGVLLKKSRSIFCVWLLDRCMVPSKMVCVNKPASLHRVLCHESTEQLASAWPYLHHELHCPSGVLSKWSTWQVCSDGVEVSKVFSTCQWNKRSAPFNFPASMKTPERHKWATGCDTKQWGLWRAALPPALSITVSVLWGGAAFCSSSLSSWYEPKHSIQGPFWMV